MRHHIALAASLLAGCSGAGEPAGLGADLAANREVWHENAPDEYHYTIEAGCFCRPATAGPFAVHVVDGAVVSIVHADRPEVIPPDGDFTIEGIFALAEAYLGSHVIALTFDPFYGYPRQIVADLAEEMIDDEMSIAVSLLPGPP